MTLITTVSGLQYQDHVVGTGNEVKRGSSFAKVHYTGWLKNPDGSEGDKFDSSLDRNDPFTFPIGVGHVIPGWEEGIIGMKAGGKRTLHIPSSLGYGANGCGDIIPPNSDLIFEVELLHTQ